MTTQEIENPSYKEHDGRVGSGELYKLLLLYPDQSFSGKNGDAEAFKKMADDRLTVDLPRIQHICEPKAQVTEDGVPQFLVMAEHKRTVERSFNVRSTNQEQIGGKKKKKKGKGGDKE